MANEAILKVEPEIPIMIKVADAAALPKGTAVKLSGDYTVSLADTANDLVGGITKVEKVANDGTTYVSVFRSGVFEVTVSGSASRGDPMTIAGGAGGANMFKSAKALTAFQASGSRTWGILLEDATTGQRKLMELRPIAQTGV
jgi:hypothetical protein